MKEKLANFVYLLKYKSNWELAFGLFCCCYAELISGENTQDESSLKSTAILFVVNWRRCSFYINFQCYSSSFQINVMNNINDL